MKYWCILAWCAVAWAGDHRVSGTFVWLLPQYPAMKCSHLRILVSTKWKHSSPDLAIHMCPADLCVKFELLEHEVIGWATHRGPLALYQWRAVAVSARGGDVPWCSAQYCQLHMALRQLSRCDMRSVIFKIYMSLGPTLSQCSYLAPCPQFHGLEGCPLFSGPHPTKATCIFILISLYIYICMY